MTLIKIDNRTLRQKVYEQLKQKMVTAELLPGQKISLRSIASQLGVSLMPVREALWQLERERAVVIRQNRNIYINQLTLAEFDEILELRLMLECRAAAEACRLRPKEAPVIVAKCLTNLAESGQNHKQYLEANHEFHLSIYQYSSMKNLVNMIENLWMRVGPYIFLVTTTVAETTQSMEFHNRMCDAFANGDSEGMVTALRDDLTCAAAGIRPLLDGDQRIVAEDTSRLLARKYADLEQK
jgi:DNA-binding GntR family transcriptional regulator